MTQRLTARSARGSQCCFRHLFLGGIHSLPATHLPRDTLPSRPRPWRGCCTRLALRLSPACRTDLRGGPLSSHVPILLTSTCVFSYRRSALAVKAGPVHVRHCSGAVQYSRGEVSCRNAAGITNCEKKRHLSHHDIYLATSTTTQTVKSALTVLPGVWGTARGRHDGHSAPAAGGARPRGTGSGPPRKG